MSSKREGNGHVQAHACEIHYKKMLKSGKTSSGGDGENV